MSNKVEIITTDTKTIEVVLRGAKGDTGSVVQGNVIDNFDSTNSLDALSANKGKELNDTLTQLIQDLIDIESTYGAIGNTVSNNTGTPNPSGIIQISFTGLNDELLTPPVSPQPLVNPDLNGYKILPLTVITSSGFLSDSGDGGLIVNAGGTGNYETPHAWLDMSSNTNNNHVGFVFGIHRGNEIYFSQRVTGAEMPNSNDRMNVSGGGFVEGLQEGDKLYVYGAAQLTSVVSIYDANLGLTMKKKA